MKHFTLIEQINLETKIFILSKISWCKWTALYKPRKIPWSFSGVWETIWGSVHILHILTRLLRKSYESIWPQYQSLASIVSSKDQNIRWKTSKCCKYSKHCKYWQEAAWEILWKHLARVSKFSIYSINHKLLESGFSAFCSIFPFFDISK